MAALGFKDLNGAHVALDWAVEGEWIDQAIESAMHSLTPPWYEALRHVHTPTGAHAQLQHKLAIPAAPWVTYRTGVEVVYPAINWYMSEMFNEEEF